VADATMAVGFLMLLGGLFSEKKGLAIAGATILAAGGGAKGYSRLKR